MDPLVVRRVELGGDPLWRTRRAAFASPATRSPAVRAAGHDQGKRTAALA
jgi:hypothetical protein